MISVWSNTLVLAGLMSSRLVRHSKDQSEVILKQLDLQKVFTQKLLNVLLESSWEMCGVSLMVLLVLVGYRFPLMSWMKGTEAPYIFSTVVTTVWRHFRSIQRCVCSSSWSWCAPVEVEDALLGSLDHRSCVLWPAQAVCLVHSQELGALQHRHFWLVGLQRRNWAASPWGWPFIPWFCSILLAALVPPLLLFCFVCPVVVIPDQTH